MDEYLSHYGIKGQRWGIRRYQNYDGSYTQRGLARYNKAADAYKDKKTKLEEAKRSGKTNAIRSARSEVREAAKKANKAYDQLKYDKRADEGKYLRKKGRTINGNTTVGVLGVLGAHAVGVAAAAALDTSGKLNDVNFKAVTTGVKAVSLIIGAKVMSDNSKLRAYYAH